MLSHLASTEKTGSSDSNLEPFLRFYEKIRIDESLTVALISLLAV